MDFGGFYARLAARFLGVPALVSGFSGSMVEKNVLSWMEYALSHITDYVISNSYAGQRCLVEDIGVNPAKVRVIQNGFDFEEARKWEAGNLHRDLRIDPMRPVVGLVARLVDVKNPLMFVDAAAIVRRNCPFAHFVAIGDGPLRSEVEARVKSLGLQQSFTLLGERSDAVNLIPGLAVGVLTSQSEGLPNAILEHMFWQRPVVVSNVGDCARIVKHGVTGYVYEPGDLRSLSNYITRLLHNREDAAAMGRAARRQLETQYSIEGYCDRLFELYEAALDSHRSRTS